MRLMRLPIALALAAAAALSAHASPALAAPNVIKQERVPGGMLEQLWEAGFDTDRNLQALTLFPSDPAYANPSGDHTVGVLTNTVQDSGGLALAVTDPLGQADYEWEGWFFTGDGNTRRGLVFRASPANDFATHYQFVINSGLFQILLRKVVNSVPSVLGSWTSNTLPGGVPAVNTWHHMRVRADANAFRVWFDGHELTGGTPIIDATSPLLTGFVGCYNFRFDLGNVPVYFDDFVLSTDAVVPARSVTFGQLKSRFAR